MNSTCSVKAKFRGIRLAGVKPSVAQNEVNERVHAR